MGLVIGTGGLHIGTSGGGASPVKRFDAEAEYIKRKAGGTDNIGTGKAKISTLKGKSLVWNQLIENGNFGSTDQWSTQSGLALSVSNNVATLVYSGSNYQKLFHYVNVIAGHKYYQSIEINAPANLLTHAVLSTASGWTYIVIDDSNANKWHRYSSFATSSVDFRSQLCYASIQTAGTSGTAYVRNAFLIDLTQMFGAGNEPATVAEFEAMYPLPYYDYNAGEIVNNAAEAIETVGFNQLKLTGRTEYSGPTTNPNSTFDFLTEDMLFKGFASNGYLIPNNVASYSVTERSLTVKSGTAGSASAYGVGFPFKVLPNTSYYIKYTSSGGSSCCLRTYVDGAGKIISNGSTSSGISFTTPQDAAWLIVTFRPGAVDAEATWTDICINLSDASKNGTYEPYWKETLQLNLPTLTGKLDGEGESVVICPDGLRSAGTAFDEAVVENGMITKIVKRVGVYTFDGTETVAAGNWRPVDGAYAALFPASMIDNFVKAPNTQIPNAVMANLQPRTYDQMYGGAFGFFLGLQSNTLYSMGVRVSSSIATTRQELVSWLSGQTVYYELAEPVEYDLVTPIGNSYKVISGGTEERLPRDTASSVIAPIKYSVKYVQPKE